ncbi:recombinase family protein [Streptosporangium sp. 'caverna']|uniref:recombinase family protein n=1 Tax=Streptosporangium sp. 'caverna' TaxID=2202249 RepID=UPI000D7E09C9|nr:recombinase family protein [Streptosporangium sp. 'caverna']AWS45009.1 hypothetical protein DKM19_30540 [Streptosporangium sp. 'caverna']
MTTSAAALRAAIYDRVSKDRRGDSRSVGEQNADNRAAVAANGWKLVEEYKDNDRSASRFAIKAREEWPRLVADLEAGRFGVLVLWEPSRGSRDLTVWSTLLDTCRERGVLIHITSHGRTYDPRNARDWRSLAEDGVDSGYESEKTRSRVLRAAASTAQNGKPWGVCPYGYLRQYDPQTRALVSQDPHPEHAPIVREIITRLANAEPISRVAKDLNAREIPSPRGKKWSTFIVRRTATSPTYIAKRTHNGEIHDATWPALVDEVTFYAAVRILSDPRRKMVPNDPAHHAVRPGRQVHLLSHLAECGKCGSPLAARFTKSMDHWSYYCHARTGGSVSKGGCASTGKEWLEEPIIFLTMARLSQPDAYQLFAGGDDAAVEAAEAEAMALEANLEDWMTKAENGEVSAAAYGRIETRLLPQIKAARQRAQDARVPLALRELLEPGVDVVYRWESLSLGGQREVLRAVYQRIALDPSKIRGGGQRGLNWTRVRVLPVGSEEWITLPPRTEAMPS